MKSAAQQRIERQANYGAAVILLVALAMAALFGGAVAHDLGLAIPCLASWFVCCVATLGAVACWAIGSEA